MGGCVQEAGWRMYRQHLLGSEGGSMGQKEMLNLGVKEAPADPRRSPQSGSLVQ